VQVVIDTYSNNKKYRDNKVDKLLPAKERTLTSLYKEVNNKDKGIGIRSLITTFIPYNYYNGKIIFKVIIYIISEKVFFKA